MENERTRKRRLRTVLIITLLLCLIDIYIIINIPDDYMILAGAALITLIFAILSINSWFKWKEMEDQHRNEQYSDIMNVQKSSYVIIQKKVQDIDDKINFIGQKIMPLEKAGDVNQRKIASLLDNIVEDQKKIAKITISRSKENADALMNSNDKLLFQMEEFRNSIASMQEQLLTQQGEIHTKESQELGDSKSEILSRIMELKELLEQEAGEISENILNSQQSLEESYNSVIEAASEVKNLNSIESSLEKQVQSEKEQETVQEEEQAAQESTVIEEQTIIPEDIPEPMAVEEQPAFKEEQPKEEPMAVEEQPAFKEEQPKEEPMAVEEQPAFKEEQPKTEPMAVEEQPMKESTKDSSLSDSNDPMSPEDIAALIAKTASEELPETTEQFQEEEKPPVPDMSDPNRPMSPEDIAALIANM